MHINKYVISVSLFLLLFFISGNTFAQSFTLSIQRNISCSGGSDGALRSTSTGNWTGPDGFTAANKSIITGLKEGVYICTVAGTSKNITLSDPLELQVDIQRSVTQGGVILAALLSGGTPGYTYTWTDPNGELMDGESISTSVYGTYALMVTDKNGCSVSTGTSITSVDTSYSDAPIMYGIAKHVIDGRLFLGTINPQYVQTYAMPGFLADKALNDDGFAGGVVPQNADGYTDLKDVNCKVNADGSLEIKVQATNRFQTGDAKLIAWIDFNKDGKFDSDEAAMVTVPSGTNNKGFSILWPKANVRIKNGVTYMRLRITQENISTDEPAGRKGNGEVEDYRLHFNPVMLVKNAKSSNKADNTRANIGDTITYTLTVNNSLLTLMSDILLLDPIPQFTKYVPNSADNSGQVSDLLVSGTLVSAVHWPLFTLAAESSKTLTFQVVVTDSPRGSVNDSIIPNIAYMVFNKDTSNSASASCNTNNIIVNPISAIDDYVTVFDCDSVLIDVLANDYLNGSTLIPLIPITGGEPKWGEIAEQNGSINYKVICGNGLKIDTFQYAICINNSCDTAKVRVSILPRPSIILPDSCSAKPVLWLDYQYEDIVYRWLYSTDQDGPWNEIKTGSDKFCNPDLDRDAYYKVEMILPSSKKISIPLIQFEILRKTSLPFGFLYETKLTRVE